MYFSIRAFITLLHQKPESHLGEPALLLQKDLACYNDHGPLTSDSARTTASHATYFVTPLEESRCI